MRWSWLLLTLACDATSFFGTSASVSSSDAGPDAQVLDCVGPAPRCAFERAPGAECEGPRFDASCIDGTWSCDPCVLGDPHCDDPRDTRRAINCPR